jgi:hypothetical protein
MDMGLGLLTANGVGLADEQEVEIENKGAIESRSYCCAFYLIGRRTRKVDPLFTSLTTSTTPPHNSTACCTITNPMPVPGTGRAVWQRWNGSNSNGISSCGMPMPLSWTLNSMLS